MSLHLNRQCQRADAYLPPVRLVPGSVVPTKKRRETATSLDKAASACWRRHIWVALQLVNVLFCKFLARPPFGSLNLAKLRRADPKEPLVSCYDLDSSSDTRFKARKSLRPKTFWRRTKGRSESLNGGIAGGRRGASDSLQIATNRASGALDVLAHCGRLMLDPLDPVLHQVSDRHDAHQASARHDRKMANPSLSDQRKRTQHVG